MTVIHKKLSNDVFNLTFSFLDDFDLKSTPEVCKAWKKQSNDVTARINKTFQTIPRTPGELCFSFNFTYDPGPPVADGINKMPSKLFPISSNILGIKGVKETILFNTTTLQSQNFKTKDLGEFQLTLENSVYFLRNHRNAEPMLPLLTIIDTQNGTKQKLLSRNDLSNNNITDFWHIQLIKILSKTELIFAIANTHRLQLFVYDINKNSVPIQKTISHSPRDFGFPCVIGNFIYVHGLFFACDAQLNSISKISPIEFLSQFIVSDNNLFGFRSTKTSEDLVCASFNSKGDISIVWEKNVKSGSIVVGSTLLAVFSFDRIGFHIYDMVLRVFDKKTGKIVFSKKIENTDGRIELMSFKKDILCYEQQEKLHFLDFSEPKKGPILTSISASQQEIVPLCQSIGKDCFMLYALRGKANDIEFQLLRHSFSTNPALNSKVITQTVVPLNIQTTTPIHPQPILPIKRKKRSIKNLCKNIFINLQMILRKISRVASKIFCCKIK